MIDDQFSVDLQFTWYEQVVEECIVAVIVNGYGNLLLEGWEYAMADR